MLILRKQKEFGIRDWIRKSADKDKQKIEEINKYLKNDCAIITNDLVKASLISKIRDNKGDYTNIALNYPPKAEILEGPEIDKLGNMLVINSRNPFIEEEELEAAKTILKIINNPELKYLVVVPSESLESIAHELGHILGIEGNFIERWVAKKSGEERRSGKVGSVMISLDEWNATRRGLKELKKVGLRKEDLLEKHIN